MNAIFGKLKKVKLHDAAVAIRGGGEGGWVAFFRSHFEFFDEVASKKISVLQYSLLQK